MTLTISDPALDQALAEQSSAHGMSAEDYAADLLRHKLLGDGRPAERGRPNTFESDPPEGYGPGPQGSRKLPPDYVERIMKLTDDMQRHRVPVTETPDESVGYDENGLPC